MLPFSELRRSERERGVFSLTALVGLIITLLGLGLLTYYLKKPEIRAGIFHDQTTDRLFPDSFVINSPALFYSLPHDSVLDPSEDEDYLLVSWLALRRLPPEGERQIIVSKFDGDSASKRGFALAVEGGEDYLRPLIYWRDD